MKRIKILKVYFILWLFVFFTISAYWSDFLLFFNAAVAFNAAVLALMAVGGLFLLNAGVSLVMLAGTFGALAYKRSGYEFYLRAIEKIMPANIANMFYSRKTQEKMMFTSEESRDVVMWLEDKFGSQRSYINFFISTPLLIGLFGTFSGLLKSIDEMGRIVISLSGEVVLKDVIESFSGPLAGMAVGFGSSLFAVGVAVILGIKGYILYRYQDIMIEGVEEWLKGRIVEVTDIGGADAQNDLPGRKESFLDLFLAEMGKLTKEIGKAAESNQALPVMSNALVSLTQQAIEQKESLGRVELILERGIAAQENGYSSLLGAFETIRNDLVANAQALDESRRQTLAKFDVIIDMGKANERSREEFRGESQAHWRALLEEMRSQALTLEQQRDGLERLHEEFVAIGENSGTNHTALIDLLGASREEGETQARTLLETLQLLHQENRAHRESLLGSISTLLGGLSELSGEQKELLVAARGSLSTLEQNSATLQELIARLHQEKSEQLTTLSTNLSTLLEEKIQTSNQVVEQGFAENGERIRRLDETLERTHQEDIEQAQALQALITEEGQKQIEQLTLLRTAQAKSKKDRSGGKQKGFLDSLGGLFRSK